MAASAITPIEVSQRRMVEVMQDANADGNFVSNFTGKQWLEFQNDGDADRTVTCDSQVLSNYGTDVNRTCVVPAGERVKFFPDVPASRWRDSDGAIQFSYDDVTDLKVAAYKWPD